MGSLSQTRVYGTALLLADAVRAALAQAEREWEDEIVKLRADVVWIAQQRDENEQWARDRAAVAIQMADERDAARAEVERLKAHLYKPMIYQMEENAALKADLARVRAALTDTDE